MIISIFTFYLFQPSLLLHWIWFPFVTGEMRGIIAATGQTSLCLFFLLPTVVTFLSSPRTGLDWLHLYWCFLPFLFSLVLPETSDTCFFRLILQTILLVVCSSAAATFGAFPNCKKKFLNYAFLFFGPIWHQNRAVSVAFFNPVTTMDYLIASVSWLPSLQRRS